MSFGLLVSHALVPAYRHAAGYEVPCGSLHHQKMAARDPLGMIRPQDLARPFKRGGSVQYMKTTGDESASHSSLYFLFLDRAL